MRMKFSSASSGPSQCCSRATAHLCNETSLAIYIFLAILHTETVYIKVYVNSIMYFSTHNENILDAL